MELTRRVAPSNWTLRAPVPLQQSGYKTLILGLLSKLPINEIHHGATPRGGLHVLKLSAHSP